jgi:GNAT superfamily N-acetyltransferase
MTEYVVVALGPDTWDGFAGLAERHNGVFGGCWCTWFHTMSADKERTYDGNESLKRRLVEQGRAHAALVYDADEVVAWCEFGSPEELPNIYHRKQYEEELDVLPDYRITCIFVDRRYRRQGLSAVALQGALDLIAAAGGGMAEGYPHDTGEEGGPLQRDPHPLRAGRLRLCAQQGHGQLRHAPHRSVSPLLPDCATMKVDRDHCTRSKP